MSYFPPTGSVVTYQSTPSSNLGGSSIYGQLPGGIAVLGSVATLQGTNPWIITGSVQGFPTNQNISGSVVAFQGGTRISSIIGAYAEDAGHTQSDPGVFILGVRNDTMASVTSADLDYGPI